MQLMDYTQSQWHKQHLIRNRQCMPPNERCFNSSDYLGLSQHPAMIHAAHEGLKTYGVTSCGSALVNGYKSAHQHFEQAFADHLGFEKALLFSSGYMANLAIAQTLTNHCQVIFFDQLCHASLIDSLQLSRAKRIRYRHNDYQQLEEKINRQTTNDTHYIMSNSVSSTDGTLSDLKQLTYLARNYQHQLIIDDAHGLGVLGQHGRGSLSHYKINPKHCHLVAYPLSKGFGCFGSMLCGSADTIDQFIQFARTYRYSSALPPLFATAGITALKLLKKEPWRQEKLAEIVGYFKQHAMGTLPLINSNTAIQAIKIGDSAKALHIQKKLAERGIRVGCLRPPSVSKYHDLIRITLSINNTTADIDDLINELASHVCH